jgi:DNA-binding CsgD family transcriptional regulator
MKKKPAPHKSLALPRRSERQVSPSPTDENSSKDALRQPLAKTNNKELRKEARELHAKNWLAPAGSVQEKQFLKRWAKVADVSQKDRDLIYQWIDKPDEFAKRNTLFWQAAKKSALGSISYETAMERHRTLDDKEWLVACFTAQGKRQKEIAKLTHIGERMVDNIILRLKDKIIQEGWCDIDIKDVGLAHIARWFFGL